MKRNEAELSVSNKSQKIIGIFFAVCTFIVTFAVPAYAIGNYTEPGSIVMTDYSANPVKCHVLSNANGSGMVVYAEEGSSGIRMRVLFLDRNGKTTGALSRDLSGSTWGGCVYRAPDGYTYVATGNSGNTAYFITKFDSGWNRIATASVSKNTSFTKTAFHAGNCDMALTGNFLIVHTARGRMDGHQSNETIYIDTKKMSPVYVGSDYGFDHVSHSFSQFVRTKGEQVYFLDHGDGYPRGLCLQSYQFPESDEERSEGGDGNQVQDLELMKFWGDTGLNYTGATLDGFEFGSDYDLVAGSSIPHPSFHSNADFTHYSGGRNVYLVKIAKDLSGSKILWLTNYNDRSYIRNLRFIKKNEDMFYILYGRETESGKKETCCIVVNSNGTVLNRYSMAEDFYCTSEAALLGNQLVWCHYVDSELGRFMVLHMWDPVSGRHQIKNIDIGASKISSILSIAEEFKRSDAEFYQKLDKKVNIGNLELLLGQTETFQLAICSSVFDKEYPTAPVVWTSSDPSIISISHKTSILSYSVSSSTLISSKYKIADVDITGRKKGKCTITVQIGDKTKSFPINVVKTYTPLYEDEPFVKIVHVKEKPKGTNVTKIRPGKRSMTVYWKKQTKNVTGYQIQYALNKKFTKKKKTITVKKNKTVKKKIKKLKGGKKYFVRIRTYRKKGKKTYYSRWSGVKTVKVKK